MPRWAVSRLCSTAVALTVLGCAIPGARDTRHIEAELKYASSESAVCQGWLRQSDVYRHLSNTFILHGDQSDAENRMAIERNASDSEKADLLKLHDRAAVCRRNNLENFGRVHPDFVALLAAWYSEDDALLVELLADRVSVGQANRVVHARLSARQAESQTVAATITEQLETSSRPATANRERAIRALQAWNREQRRILQYRQRISPADAGGLTNCTYAGDDISCTSY